MNFQNSIEFAQQLDIEDVLYHYKSQFYFPKINGKDVIYFAGNSLGLQPKIANDYVQEVMTDWKNLAVEGHFHSEKPWWDYQEQFAKPLSKVVGALPTEVTVMNTLTVNLHLLMVSFYRPTAKRYKIICEAKAFPSDQYLFQSQVNFHGFAPQDAIVEVFPKAGSHTITNEDIIAKIEEVGDTLALVMIGGVNYYTGQVFDIQKITAAGHQVGAKVGWDLAHAAGNIALALHDWNVDFAAWCSYKYMNAGPGNISGCFVHQKHHFDTDLPRFAGWWGHNKEKRFLMEQQFQPINTVEGWQISNLSILSMAPYLASLQLFNETGMPKLIAKRDKITAYLEYVLLEINREVNGNFEIITPSNIQERGCQLSVFLHGQGRPLFHYLMENGVLLDWREPNVIRLAPVPLYTSYEDVYQFGQILKQGILI